MTGTNVIQVANDAAASDSDSFEGWFVNRVGMTTSHTLLANIRKGDQNAWIDLDYLYRPLLEDWCQAEGVPEHDLETVANAIFVVVNKSIARYEHVSFRGWLRRITYTQAKDYFRQQRGEKGVGGSDFNEVLKEWPEPEPEPSFETNAEYTPAERTKLLRQIYEQVLANCTDRTREIFTRVVEHQEKPSAVAAEFGLKVDRIYSLRSQVLKRMNDARQALEAVMNDAPNDALPHSPPPNPPT